MTRALLLASLVAAATLAGCAGFGSGLLRTTVPETDRWLVVPRRPGDATPPAGTLHLAVPAFHVTRAFSERTFVYRQADGRWDLDPWREFLVAPGEMLSDAARHWLRDSGLFATVQAGESRVTPDLVLEADVAELFGDYSTTPAAAVISLRVLVVDIEAGVRHRAVYARRRPLADDTPTTLAAGWEAAYGEILADLERDLAAIVAAPTERQGPVQNK